MGTAVVIHFSGRQNEDTGTQDLLDMRRGTEEGGECVVRVKGW